MLSFLLIIEYLRALETFEFLLVKTLLLKRTEFRNIQRLLAAFWAIIIMLLPFFDTFRTVRILTGCTFFRI